MAIFIDLKAAFDSVDRRVLGESLQGRGVSKGLRERIMEIYEETRSVGRVREIMGKEFWTERWVKQGCPLSPILFNLMIADLEEGLGKDGIGGIGLGGKKVKVLGYADDLVMLAEDEEGMRWLLERLERYLDRKELMLNAEKTKVVKFGKGERRKRKAHWWWKGREIEEVKEMMYLGYRFKRNGGQEAQVEERARKAMGVLGQVWGIGKRRFGGDWKKRMNLFDCLVGSVVVFGAEIWGWRE